MSKNTNTRKNRNNPNERNQNANDAALLQTTWGYLRNLTNFVIDNPKKIALTVAVSILGTLISRINISEVSKCVSRVDQFVPKDSPAFLVTKLLMLSDCLDVEDSVPELFTKTNGYAYSTEFCFFRQIQCNNMNGLIHSPDVAKKATLDPKQSQIQLVPEGSYGITTADNIIVTASVSYCVALSISSSKSSKVLLAHINADNIKAHDEYLKGRLENPFAGIRSFIANKKLDWQVTLASGSPANLVYIKTILEDMGLLNIRSYVDHEWSVSSSRSSAKVNSGNLMIKMGETLFITNENDFQKLIPPLPESKKGKPAALTLSSIYTPELGLLRKRSQRQQKDLLNFRIMG